jgi:hypothetical protein
VYSPPYRITVIRITNCENCHVFTPLYGITHYCSFQ